MNERNEESQKLYKAFEIKIVVCVRQTFGVGVEDVVEGLKDEIYGDPSSERFLLGYSVVGKEEKDLTIDAAKKIFESIDDPQKVFVE